MPEYFIRRGDTVSGPISPVDLQYVVANGGISAGDLVGKSENGPWHEAKSVPGLVFPDSKKSAELSDDEILQLLDEYEYEPETPSPADAEKELAEPGIGCIGKLVFWGIWFGVTYLIAMWCASSDNFEGRFNAFWVVCVSVIIFVYFGTPGWNDKGDGGGGALDLFDY